MPTVEAFGARVRRVEDPRFLVGQARKQVQCYDKSIGRKSALSATIDVNELDEMRKRLLLKDRRPDLYLQR